MPRFLLLLCAGAALTFEGCQTVAGDVARQDTELAGYLQDRWVAFDAPAAASESAPELFCRNGQWRSRGATDAAAGHYVLKASTICVSSGEGRSCRTFSKTADGRYVAASTGRAMRPARVQPLAGATALAIRYACDS